MRFPTSNSCEAFTKALKALRGPLRFASADDFRRLHRIRDLEHSLRLAATAAKTTAPNATSQNLLADFLKELPKKNATTAARKIALTKCVALLNHLGAHHAPKDDHVTASHPHSNNPPYPRSTGVQPVDLIKKPPPGPELHHEPPQPLSTTQTTLRLDSPVQFLKGVGPKVAALLSARHLHTVENLLRYLPRRYDDLHTSATIGEITQGQHVTVCGAIRSHNFRRAGRRSTLEVVIGDATGTLHLLWFRVPGKGFADRFVRGQMLRASGMIKRYRNKLQMTHPQTTVVSTEQHSADAPASEADTIMPSYLEVAGLAPSHLRRLIAQVLPVASSLTDSVPQSLLHVHDLPALGASLRALHAPPPGTSIDDLNSSKTPWHQRLIYEELLLLQLAVVQRKAMAAQHDGEAIPSGQSYRDIARELFPFALTASQQRVLLEIEKDLSCNKPMNRLLQGDVGSGKTAVALTAAVAVAQAGLQTVIMAPTELLAEQHARVAMQALAPANVRIGLLTGKLSTAEKRRVLEELADGSLQIVVGTHALIQKDVQFARLALAIIDEQHRFGVMQRARLLELGRAGSGNTPHVMVMTATPIPRTLALTVYGDLDVSVIDGLPPGRKAIATTLFREPERVAMYKQVAQAVARGRQAYVVFPLVEESDKEGMEGVRDATGAAEELAHGSLQGISVGLLHGRMDSDDKDRVMRKFHSGHFSVLIATTVIEVGIDVPNATIMVIEHAERFGLSQLHQLRGRVGRGEHKSACFLLAQYKASDEAWDRLMVMTQTQDGFKIAEEDLKIRGPGDFIGTRQSGLPVLSVANLMRDAHWLEKARRDAASIIDSDPTLQHTEHQHLVKALQQRWDDPHDLARIG